MYNGHLWMNFGMEALRFQVEQNLATGSILFISRSWQVFWVRLKLINTGGADRGGVNL
jgi:hypothetical protein